MVLSGYKEIAAYLAAKIGSRSIAALKRYAKDATHPLPVRGDSGRVVAHTEELNEWVARRWRLRSA